MKLYEIDRLTGREYTGGKAELSRIQDTGVRMRPLPGGSRFKYYISGNIKNSFTVVIVDPDAKMPAPDTADYRYSQNFEADMQKFRNSGGRGNLPVGKLSLYPTSFPAPNAVNVSGITVDEDYRGQGLAMALYGIVINVMGCTLVSGDSQTPGGRKNWLNLASIPGCEVNGYLIVRDDSLTSSRNTGAETLIDRIMMVGGEYQGEMKKYNYLHHVFLYPVTVNGQELKNAVVGSDVKLYHGDATQIFTTGLVARWVG